MTKQQQQCSRGASLVAQWGGPSLPVQEMQVRSLGREDPLKKEMTTLSNILAWESHGQRSMVVYTTQSRKGSDTTKQCSTDVKSRESEDGNPWIQMMPPDAAIENGHVEMRAGGAGGTNWEIRTDIYTLPCAKQTASGKLPCSTGSSAGCSVVA